MTYGQAENKCEELGKELRRKITRRNITEMMDNGELTMEESEIELRNLESRENKDNKVRNDKHNNNRNETARPDPIKAPQQQLPKKIHATIVPSIYQRDIQKPKQPIYGGKDQVAPKCNNEEKNECDDERETLPGIDKDKSNKDKDKNEEEVIPNKRVNLNKGVNLNKTATCVYPFNMTENVPMIHEYDKHTKYTLSKNTEWNNDKGKAATDKNNDTSVGDKEMMIKSMMKPMSNSRTDKQSHANVNTKHTTFTSNANKNKVKRGYDAPLKKEQELYEQYNNWGNVKMSEENNGEYNDTRSISQNSYEPSTTEKKNKNEMHQVTYWLIIFAVVLTTLKFYRHWSPKLTSLASEVQFRVIEYLTRKFLWIFTVH